MGLEAAAQQGRNATHSGWVGTWGEQDFPFLSNLAFFTSALRRKPFQRPTARASTMPNSLHSASYCWALPSISPTHKPADSAGLIGTTPAPLWGHPSLGHVSQSRNTQEDFEVPTLVRSRSSALERDGW